MAEDERPVSADVDSAYQPGHPVYYANTIHIASSLHDVRLSFAKARPGEGNIFDVSVYLPPTAAKQLARMLTDAVNLYEQEFGAINLEAIKKDD